MKLIKAIIVDDELHCRKALNNLLERYCPQVQVQAICNNGEEALSSIRQLTPDLVFLDVEMPKMNGFEMLEQLTALSFHLIFTTSFDQYALKAFRFSAVDYLLKPIDHEELILAVRKVSERSQIFIPQQLEILLQRIHQPSNAVNKIALPTMEGLQMIALNDILFCESDDNYTNLFLKNKKKIVISSTLKEIEFLLEDFAFTRVHRSYVANLNEIEKYIKGEGGYLVMSDGSTIDVSRSRKEPLLKKLLSIRS
jgi:Response regulator of the LytR/AlgR family